MTVCRVALILFVALVPLWGCGGGCSRGDDRKTDAGPRPTTTSIPSTTTSTTAAAVEPDGTYRLYRPTRWKVGDVVTDEATTTTTGHTTQVPPDGRLSALPDVIESLHATWIEKATDVGADGRRTRYLVYLTTWSRRRGQVRDASIQGTSLTVSGVGAARTWSLVEHQNEPTPEARNWLDEHFGSRGLGDEQWLRIMLPDEGVVPGGSWSPDPALLAREVAGSGLSIDRPTGTAMVTLEAVEGGMARCAFKANLTLLRVPNSDTPWSKGGTLAFEGDMSIPLGSPLLILAKLHRRAALEGETMQDGVTARYDFVTDEQRTTTPGGTFPESEPGH